ncbi:uncharacterized protein BDZ83DRAFT_618454 [Colletotrichum acutatum]|uniref:Uncharacterized protein n=1 Tax=Glomerella acutata TaxID=27357 RepID=A0AAD8XIA0_GLOAC|nr:uncharacterized protein BDZ83DRAFT_618454 [Colletotrichum acutatum]KAK1725788.1 hypothetical protein BDZ83DRAFT_618454 [Colletotrichum acutatum]
MRAHPIHPPPVPCRLWWGCANISRLFTRPRQFLLFLSCAFLCDDPSAKVLFARVACIICHEVLFVDVQTHFAAPKCTAPHLPLERADGRFRFFCKSDLGDL